MDHKWIIYHVSKSLTWDLTCITMIMSFERSICFHVFLGERKEMVIFHNMGLKFFDTWDLNLKGFV